MSNQNTKNSPGIKFPRLTVPGRWEWIILAIWISYVILFLFCNKRAKKNCVLPTPTAESFSYSHTSQCAFSWTTPARLRAYVLYGWPPNNANNLITCQINIKTKTSGIRAEGIPNYILMRTKAVQGVSLRIGVNIIWIEPKAASAFVKLFFNMFDLLSSRIKVFL